MSRPGVKKETTGGKGRSTSLLDSLVVFDSLTVGPVRLEPKRLRAAYVLKRGRTIDQIEFTYRFDEEVFDPEDPASLNLAALMAAQVAVNYGLFCKRLVFHGVLDRSDQAFLQAAVENTCREIYVKKFLEPNPFLVKLKLGPEPELRSVYTAAELEFPDAPREALPSPWRFQPSEPDRHAVLSSGGKDSLLSFGLIREAGFEVHPMFANESGRHWQTALNAFRHFKAEVPNTARVWVNADRVFAWMLRHMPFIRPDFARLRSDDYPIRLWTVAVFGFGVVPLLLKRRIGRLVIGDEYDTTDRRTHKGIRHYNGLYDQSRHFDAAMSRFFMRKGWSVSQFSVLRPMSELLIQKVLSLRYPELQKHQTSCHATHVDHDRVKPCGKCEKCRRIVAMLSVLGVDPKRCGYTQPQVKAGLKAVVEKGVHQEVEGLAHLLWMLGERGVFDTDGKSGLTGTRHPEIMQLRFDQRRSTLDDMPTNLRRPILSILLEYGDGAVRKEGRAWKAFDPLAAPGLRAPYAFETHGSAPQPTSEGGSLRRSDFLWAELSWPEAAGRIKDMDVALLPVGAIEQHGPHLTLDVDTWDADYLARRVASACSQPRPLVLPTIPYGVSYHHDEFAGTLSINNDTLSRLVYDIGMSVARQGIRKLVIINGHGDNTPTLCYAAQMINRDARIFVCVDTGETSDVDVEAIASTPNDVHAGEIETSTSLATRPHLVRMNLAKSSVPRFSSRYLNFSSSRGLPWYAHTKRISESGVMGDPTKADAEKGQKMWAVMIAHLVALVEDLKNMTLEEIFQKRY
jgi:creatinine amidohydrolase/Fe(II)-dependent formamide hydrolase-like protein